MKKVDLTVKKIKETLNENNDIFRKFKIKRIGLFGSYIRGEQRKDSDIDICRI